MKRLYVILLFLMSAGVFAQNSLQPNIFLNDLHYYNPAAVGISKQENLSITAYGKQRFVEGDIYRKPLNPWINYVNRVRENDILTVSYIHDSYSYFSRNSLYLGYVREFSLGKSSVLGLGGRVVGNVDRVNWDKFQLPHLESGNTVFFNPELDLGVHWMFYGLKAGAGFKNLLGSSAKHDNAVLIQNRKELNFNLSYRQNLGQNFQITPLLLVNRERNTLINAGLSVNAFKKLNVSYILRLNQLRGIYGLDFTLPKGLSVGLSLDRSVLMSDNNFDFVLRYRK